MRKRIKDFAVDFKIKWKYATEIKKMREDLDALEALGATHVHLEPDIDYDCPTLNIYAISRRMETDEDVKARAAEVLAQAQRVRNAELEQLMILQAKYGQ